VTNSKQSKLDAINEQIAQLNAKYVADKKAKQVNSGGEDAEGMSEDLSNLYNTYQDNYNALMAQYQELEYSN
jgi:Skp family chaperone for outer membrane proteins